MVLVRIRTGPLRLDLRSGNFVVSKIKRSSHEFIFLAKSAKSRNNAAGFGQYCGRRDRNCPCQFSGERVRTMDLRCTREHRWAGTVPFFPVETTWKE